MKKQTIINIKSIYKQSMDVFCFCITAFFLIIRIIVIDISPRIADLIYVIQGACYLEGRLKNSRKIDYKFMLNILFLALLRVFSLYIATTEKNYSKIIIVIACSMLYTFLLIIRKSKNEELERKHVNLSYVWLWVIIPNLVSF